MYCYQPPLQPMYCPSQPPFHQVGLGQVGNFPPDLRMLCVGVVCGCVCECLHLDGQVGAAGPGTRSGEDGLVGREAPALL